MKKSQLETLIREVIRETIRKVDGKYVVYPEKGGKRLGTHSTKKAAEKQLTAIHLNKEAVEIKYINPNFDAEWEEAVRYPEFNNMGKESWIRTARVGQPVFYSSIKDVLGNVDLNFKGLEEPKKQRFQAAFQKGTIEMPIAVKFSDDDYDLVAGNTRLSGLVQNGIDPKIWIVDLSDIQENYVLQNLEDRFNIDLDLYDDGKALTLSRIVIPKDKRGQGIGSKVMNLIVQYADAQNKPIYLTPSKDFGGTSTGRLEQFYKQFGFKKKDKSDFSTKETMVREPQTAENFADGKVNEQEMSQDDFNTIGNILRDSTKAKQIHSLLLQMFPQQKELLNYNFKNDSYAEFKRFIFHIDKYKLEGPVSINHTDLKLDPQIIKDRERKYQDYINGKVDKYFRDTNADPRKVDLSKMPPITVDETGQVMDGNHRAFLAIKQQKPLKGYKIVNANNTHPNTTKILQIVGREIKENYADGKVKGKSRPGRVKRAGASCKGSVTDLRAKAKKYGGEKGKMYHWCANMKSGRKK